MADDKSFEEGEESRAEPSDDDFEFVAKATQKLPNT